MKKRYVLPTITIVEVSTNTIAISGDIKSNLDIEYGGYDVGGSLIPETKIARNIWDEEW